MIKYASPLYILRNRCAEDLFGVMRDLGGAGFDGIEFLGFFGHGAAAVKRELAALNMSALGNHVPLNAFYADIEGTLAFHAEVGCQFITLAEFGGDFSETADKVHAIAEAARVYDVRLLYHNHDFELVNRAGNACSGDTEQLEYIMDNIPACDMSLEPDLGWIEIGGGDPARYLLKYADRCPVIHLKDYYATATAPGVSAKSRPEFEFRPTGYGVMNLPKLFPLCQKCAPEWYVLDHDEAYSRDAIADLRLSLEFVKTLSIINKE